MTAGGAIALLATFALDDDAAPARRADAADRADVAQTLAGDGDAFARIVHRHQPLLTRRMARFSRDVGEVETLVHDAFVEAYLGLPRYRAAAPFEHWLRRIATHVGYRFWTRRARATLPLDASTLFDASTPGAAGVDVVERDDEIERLRAAVDRLAPRDRLVVTPLSLDGHSVAETSALSGWSRTMVKVQAFRARARLRKLLEHSAV